MGAKPADASGTPVFFTKPCDALAHDGDVIPYPPMTQNLHHEIELVAALHKGGRDIPPEMALDCVFGYTAGLDLTRRDLQQKAKEGGKPWDMAKGFDHAAPCGILVPAGNLPTPLSGRIYLSVNGGIRQEGDLADMIWSVPALISSLSRFLTLRPGDILMTGTPAGVGALASGDKVDAGIEGIAELSVTIR